MKHLYPNVSELHAFTCSAKYLNFSYAARELGLTPSAVSRQIANLEALFGVKLFVREGRSLVLTRAGQVYHARVAGPLREIGNASIELLSARENGDLLTIASVPTFTTVARAAALAFPGRRAGRHAELSPPSRARRHLSVRPTRRSATATEHGKGCEAIIWTGEPSCRSVRANSASGTRCARPPTPSRRRASCTSRRKSRGPRGLNAIAPRR